MKTLRLLSLVTFAAGFAAASLLASDVKKSECCTKSKLQVSIKLPEQAGGALDEDTYAMDMFASTLTKTFRKQGYAGEAVILRTGSTAKTDAPLLSLNLVEWRSTIPGEMYCAFDATLTHGDKKHDLGRIFGSESMSLDQEHSMKSAANTAMKKLYQQLSSGALLAEFTPAAK